jgi:hypothetical protein
LSDSTEDLAFLMGESRSNAHFQQPYAPADIKARVNTDTGIDAGFLVDSLAKAKFLAVRDGFGILCLVASD